LIAPEGVGANVITVPPGHAVQAPGATQAVARRRHVVVNWVDDETTVNCPSLLGAIVAKAAGSREIASLSQNERLKHEGDFVFLLSLATSVDSATINPAELTSKDRKRIRRAIAPIVGDAIHPARTSAENFDDVASLAEELTESR
jgi:hypothetical protein